MPLETALQDSVLAPATILSHVSHELRSPLSVVYQFGSLLQDGIGGPLSEDSTRTSATSWK
jgi:signal transduction histidine kinase